ncbi:MAG: flavodoxin family protein [Clostridiales bacterium]|nr:flavodoxin family protein [Clostridiales bacterium]
MKIVILNGSPRQYGNTRQLAAAFDDGAAAAGHEAVHFHTAAMNIGPCLACYHCRQEATIGQCSQKDDMRHIYAALEQSQVVVFATPLYYFGFSAQIKTAIDRFFAVNGSLRRTIYNQGGIARMALLAVCGDENETAMSGLVENYRQICSYLGIENAGEILATGVYDEGDILGHAALDKAQQLAAFL